METGNDQFSCAPDEYFDGITDKCTPCENVCTKDLPLTFCKNNCPEFFKKLTTETNRSIAAFVDTPRTTFVDNLLSTSTTTESSPNYTSHSLDSPTLQVIPLTTLLALIAAVVAICIAIVAFVLICKARRRVTYGGRCSDTENPLLHRSKSGSLCTSNLSTSSSNGGCTLNAQNELLSKVPVVCNRSAPPDVTRNAKAGDDERKLETKQTPSCSGSNSNSSSSSSDGSTTTIIKS